MPSKIDFSVIFCSGEDERYRAADLNYHGPTVKGWRSSYNCGYPQDITLQLHFPSIIHKIQFLVHQYLIPHKIEIWICEDADYDPSISPCGLQSFQYIGFITLSDNQATGFKSRELKSVTTPPVHARFVKLRLYENHPNERNIYNQVGVVAVSVLGDRISVHTYGDQINNNDSLAASDINLICNPQYTSPYDDLAFEMYVDRDVARIMRLLERKKHQAVVEERFEYASKLKNALDELKGAGETLGRYDQEKRQAINMEDYDRAKSKKNQIDKYRDEIYTRLCVEQLLELEGACGDNDVSGYTQNCAKELADVDDNDEGNASCESRTELEDDTLLVVQAQNSNHVSWSPRHAAHQPRRTSLTDYPTHRTSPSPNPLSHSFSHTSFPTSHSIHQLESQEMGQLESHAPYHYMLANNVCAQPFSQEHIYQSLPPIRFQESVYFPLDVDSRGIDNESCPQEVVTHSGVVPMEQSQSPPFENPEPRSRTNSRTSSRQRSKSTNPESQNSYEAYEERMLPALRHPQMPHLNDVVRDCQLPPDQGKKSKLNDREKKQAALPIAVFGIELVEKFYSKHFADKEEGLRYLQEALQKFISESEPQTKSVFPLSSNKMARASIALLHRALRDKVYSVYSAAADVTRFFFHEFVPGRVSQAEVARSVEKLLPELIAKAGDVTPRIHNMAAHTLLSMVDCKQVRDLHIIPACLSRPLASSVHPRLALSRLEMIEQLILNHGISSEKQSGLTCRTLAEFGSSGLHHPAEAVRKVSERVLLQVYKINPRIVRKQLPPDDDVTRRNLLYRQLFQEFDQIDLQKRRDQEGQESIKSKSSINPASTLIAAKGLWNTTFKESKLPDNKHCLDNSAAPTSYIPKRTVNQMTSPIQPLQPFATTDKDTNQNTLKIITATKYLNNNNYVNCQPFQHETLLRRRNMTRISEEDGCFDVAKEPNRHFSNMIDSVHLATTKKSFEQKINQKKTIEYIFPTTYIGSTDKSKDNKSKIPVKNGTWKKLLVNTKPKVSGIPVLKNVSKSSDLVGALSTHTKTGIPVPEARASIRKSSLYMPQRDNRSASKPSARSELDDNNCARAVTPPNQDDKGAKSTTACITCIFCLERGEWLSQESLNNHYWKACPMLTQCFTCNEVVEISGLIQHRLDDCEYSKSFIKCDNCLEAILKDEWDAHLCKKAKALATRCPLCHEDLTSDEEWRNHLMGKNLCSHHPRNNKQKS